MAEKMTDWFPPVGKLVVRDVRGTDGHVITSGLSFAVELPRFVEHAHGKTVSQRFREVAYAWHGDVEPCFGGTTDCMLGTELSIKSGNTISRRLATDEDLVNFVAGWKFYYPVAQWVANVAAQIGLDAAEADRVRAAFERCIRFSTTTNQPQKVYAHFTEWKAAQMEGKQKVVLTFAIYQNEALVRREMVAHDVVKVGKDAKSQLRVDDELASRMHAVIEVASPEDITLLDLGNELGTMVNGARVNKCKIRPGDQLQIGGMKIVLESAEPVAAAAAPPRPGAPVPEERTLRELKLSAEQQRTLLERKLDAIVVVAMFSGMTDLAEGIDSIADNLYSPDAVERAQSLHDIYTEALKVADEHGIADDVRSRLDLASRLVSSVLKVLS